METNKGNIIVIMGVSGSGKTTIGELLSEKLSLPFYDADDYHSEENQDKMENGIPLTDEDRLPWLELLSKKIKKWEKGFGAILACSALKESYRKVLNGANKSIIWIYLYGKQDLIKQRIEEREDHFFDVDLLQSQFDTLEIPKYGFHININQKPDTIVQYVINKLAQDGEF